MNGTPSFPERDGPIPPGLLAEVDQLEAAHAEYGEESLAILKSAMASINSEDREPRGPGLPSL